MFGKKDDQVSEASKMTPEGGAEGTPGTEDATPGAIDTQHSPHEGNRDYSRVDDDRTHAHDHDSRLHDRDRDDRVRDGLDDEEAPQRLVSTTDTPEGEHHHGEHHHRDHVVDGRSGTEGVDGGETFRAGGH